MAKVNFIFTIHFHQPTGQFKWVNEKIYENSYKLLLEIFEKYADQEFTVHISGPLLLYMIEYHDDWLNRMARLGDYGTIEFLAGSLGEAILPLLPFDDRINQVREYIRLFEKYFGFKPRGLWLPERVWEPSLPYFLARNGIEYVLVDDSTLYRAGRGGEDAYYAWITEEGGEKVKVFFIDTTLRYVLPWSSSEEVFNYMYSKASDEGDRVLVWGSDAEKFGEWRDPGWARWWLNDFLSKLRTINDIKMIHPSKYLREHGVKGLLYLPTGSYDKMLEWSGGFFRNFLLKYRESNNMHKKMLYVRDKLDKAPSLPEEAWRYYYLAQCNDAYWHGLFGGIYLSHLRQAIYEYYIKAERIAEEYIDYYSSREPIIKFYDFDLDGRKEILYESRRINAYFKPDDGGTLFELDVKLRGYEHNLQDTMTRYWEPYIEGTGINPDWYRRVSLRIHLWSPDTSLRDWMDNTPFKDQSDLALSKYVVSVSPENTISMSTFGAHYLYGLEPARVFAEKRIRMKDAGLETKYIIVNKGNRNIKTLVGLEYHIAPKINREDKGRPLGYIIDREYHSIDEEIISENKKIIVKSAKYPDIIIEETESNIDETNLWISPLYMPARTEKGIRKTFQGLAIMFVKPVELKPGEKLSSTIDLHLMI